MKAPPAWSLAAFGLVVSVVAWSCETFGSAGGGEDGGAADSGASDSGASDSGAADSAPAPKRANCNGNPNDGDEADLSNDAANCGSCKRSCGTQPCAAGMCQWETLAKGSGPVETLSLTSDSVYFAQGPRIYEVGKSGAGTPRMLADLLHDVHTVVASSTGLYACNYTSGAFKIDTDGGTRSIDPGPSAVGIAVSNTQVWVLKVADANPGVMKLTSYTVGADGGVPWSNSASVTSAGYIGDQLFNDDRSLYFPAKVGTETASTPYRVPLDFSGGARVADVPGVFRIRSNGQQLATYRTNSELAIRNVATGGEVVLARANGLATNQANGSVVSSMVFDGDALYFTDATRVARVFYQTVPPRLEVLADNQNGATALAVDKDFVYWGVQKSSPASAEGQVRKVHR